MTGAYKLAATEERVIVLQKRKLQIVDPNLLTVEHTIDLAEDFTVYEPTIVIDSLSHETSVFIMSDNGNIYKYYQNNLTCIFHNSLLPDKPTNIAISKLGSYSPCLIFGIRNKLYTTKADGTLLPGYPVYLEGYNIKSAAHLKVLNAYNRFNKSISEVIYLPLFAGGYLAVNADGSINNSYSLTQIRNDSFNQTLWDGDEDKLFWFFTNNQGSLMDVEIENQAVQPISWSGFRNGNNGYAKLNTMETGITSSKLKAYVFPNPVSDEWVSIRTENPTGKVNIHVYDIAGNLLFNKSYSTDPVAYKDVQLDVSKYSSGIYIAVIENRNQTKRCKFAVEK